VLGGEGGTANPGTKGKNSPRGGPPPAQRRIGNPTGVGGAETGRDRVLAVAASGHFGLAPTCRGCREQVFEARLERMQGCDGVMRRWAACTQAAAERPAPARQALQVPSSPGRL